MNIYFLRHCEADYRKDNQGNVLNIPLTKKGQRHANKIAKTLSKKSFDVIICSDALRAIQTIEPYVISTDVKITYDKRLREVEDILTGYGKIHRIKEPITAQKKRLDNIVKGIRRMKCNNILIVAHFNVIDYISKKFGEHVTKPQYGSLNRIFI